MSLIDTTQPATSSLPNTLRLGAVHLTVADLDRSVAWYQRSLGLRVHTHDLAYAELGDGHETVVVLHEDPQARPAGRHAGLYHYALLYPTREELARAAVRLAGTRSPIQGASDHGTHEAIYLPDADGNGIELAWDREPELWPEIPGRPAPLDFESLLATVAGEQPSDFVGEGLRMGHLHLHVGDVKAGLAFYRDELGFELKGDWGSAAFVSAGGYHHHLGFNVWNGPNVDAPGPHTVGLRRWTVQLPTDADVAELRERLERAGRATEAVDGGFQVRDPWGTALAVVSTAATGLRARALVRTEKPSPYLKQVATHFRHKLDVRFDDHGAVIPFAFGHVQLRVGDGELHLEAFAQTPGGLARVEQVVGSHLERFGRRDELVVRWKADR
ncbi:MAG TPA: DUF2218 domain-containing protein [Solirubrobacteraceae bacterium]|nr:DUF2218 domain-containing protein [Solirubrobacteraceae bacterium]